MTKKKQKTPDTSQPTDFLLFKQAKNEKQNTNTYVCVYTKKKTKKKTGKQRSLFTLKITMTGGFVEQ